MRSSASGLSENEKERIADLLSLVPQGVETALDVGARDGHISALLAERVPEVTALDLERPSVEHAAVRCVEGDATGLEFADASFDLVFCTEVLEHIPGIRLAKACAELSRVSSRYLIIGVPYRQDTRVGRTTCATCGCRNPPWGHVNRFDERTLPSRFPEYWALRTNHVGNTDSGTNFVSALLMDWAGNPYGTYSQSEPCIQCGAALRLPPPRNLAQKVSTRLATYLQNLQSPFVKRHASWLHILFEKKSV